MINKKKAESLYKKSISILKKVQLENGGCLATPKGERYPYVYPRDHAIILLAFLSAGKVKEARKGLEFIFKSQLDNGAFPQRLDTEGKDASYKPIQLDGTALVLYAFARYCKESKSKSFQSKYWAKASKAAEYIIKWVQEDKGLAFTPNSIHEFPPAEEGLEIWANAASSAALMELSELENGSDKEMERFKEEANRIKKGIVTYMWNPRIKGFIKNIRLKESSSVLTDPDASTYGVADFGVLSDDDKRIKQDVKRIEKNLWHKKLGGLCRYPKHEGRNNGGWGPWPHFTLMVARHFIRTGQKKKADDYINWVIKIGQNNLLPEHIATVNEFEEYVTDYGRAGLLRPDRKILIENARKNKAFKKGVAYITTPLAWPHAEFIRTWNLYKSVFGK